MRQAIEVEIPHGPEMPAGETPGAEALRGRDSSSPRKAEFNAGIAALKAIK